MVPIQGIGWDPFCLEKRWMRTGKNKIFSGLENVIRSDHTSSIPIQELRSMKWNWQVQRTDNTYYRWRTLLQNVVHPKILHGINIATGHTDERKSYQVLSKQTWPDSEEIIVRQTTEYSKELFLQSWPFSDSSPGKAWFGRTWDMHWAR